jgi:hypothetical protein
MAGSAPGGRGVTAPNHPAVGTAPAELSANRGAAAGQGFLPAGLSRPIAGSWRVDPARSQASFAARVLVIDSQWVTRQRIPHSAAAS